MKKTAVVFLSYFLLATDHPLFYNNKIIQQDLAWKSTSKGATFSNAHNPSAVAEESGCILAGNIRRVLLLAKLCEVYSASRTIINTM
jgi:hypothetical protein